MPLETEIPMNIEDYRAKLLFGLTGRQLLCAAIAVVCSFATYLPLVFIVHFPDDYVAYFIFIVAAPSLLIGFVRPNGEPFEVYAKLYLRHRGAVRHLALMTNTVQKDKKGGDFNQKRNKQSSEVLWAVAPKDGKAAGKAARRRALAAAKECKAAGKR